MKAVVFPDEPNISYHYIDWDEYGQDIFKLSKQIIKGEKHLPDRIVSIAKGGLTLSASLRDYLGITKLSNIQVSSYSNIDKREDKPAIIQTLPINIKGENVLIFDDINDTGNTLKLATQYIKKQGASKVITAAVYQKPHTHTPADYYQHETECWVIFPDEIRESITLLQRNWQEKGHTQQEIEKRLLKIGFLPKHLDLVLHNKL